jgi:ribosomal protein S18 acetylase RimI-like enzyme
MHSLSTNPKSEHAKITFQAESINAIWQDEDFREAARRLHEEHVGAMRPDQFDYDMYRKCEKAGAFRAWGVRDAGRLIGFMSFWVRSNPHYGRDWLMALLDLQYVMPEYRHGFIPLKMWTTAEKYLKESGIKAIYHAKNVKHNHDKVLERLGYKPLEIVYEKNL